MYINNDGSGEMMGGEGGRGVGQSTWELELP